MRAKISVATFADTAPSSSRTMAWIARSSNRRGSPGVRPAKARTRVRSCAWVAGWSAAKRAETTSSSAAASCQLGQAVERRSRAAEMLQQGVEGSRADVLAPYET